MKSLFYFFILLSFICFDSGLSEAISSQNSDSRNKIKAKKYTLVVLPDTQNYTVSEKNMINFEKQIDWIIDNYLNENIFFISHVGDVISYPYNSNSILYRSI